MIDLKPSSRFGEIPGGRDIFPIYDHPLSSGGAPVWEVEDEGDVRVYAAPMSHGVPCVGYVVEEESKPGRLRPDLVEPIVKRNYNALREAGMKSPMKVMAVIKDLPEGGHFTFPDGTVLNQSDVVEPSRNGRKVVICGDTADARAMEKLAQSASLVIHEATNTFLAGVDRDTNMKQVTKDAISAYEAEQNKAATKLQASIRGQQERKNPTKPPEKAGDAPAEGGDAPAEGGDAPAADAPAEGGDAAPAEPAGRGVRR